MQDTFLLTSCRRAGPDNPTLPLPTPITQPLIPPSPDLTLAQISFNALSGTSTTEAFRLFGFIHHFQVTVLIDGGSTHNFIQSWVAKYLQLPATQTTPLQVTVGNGTMLPCEQVCSQTPLSLQGHVFMVDLHVLPISRADIVLGIQWLKQLGSIVMNYDSLTMQFAYNYDV